jgi:hypothetical protein
MGQFRTDIIILLGLLILSLIILLTGQSTIDIQIYDTYYVLDKVSLTVLVIGPLTFLIFFIRGLTRKFRTNGTNIGLIIGLILIGLITYHVVRSQQHYLIEMMKLNDEGQPDRGQFIVETKNKIKFTWGLLGLWIIAGSLLTLRTIKIWKEGYSS